MKKNVIKTMIPYVWMIWIAVMYIICFPGKWYLPETVFVYFRQGMVWFPAITAMLLLAVCKEVNFALGEQMAFGVCMAGILKNEWQCPDLWIGIMLILVMILISALYGLIYHFCRIRFLWITIAFKFLFSEVNILIKQYMLPGEAILSNQEFVEIIMAVICTFGAVVYLNFTMPGKSLALAGREEKEPRNFTEQVKIGAILVSGVLLGAAAVSYYSRSGSTTVVQGEYLGNTLLQVLGICGIFRLSGKNLLPRAFLGSLAFVILHAVEQEMGFGSRADLMISGFLFLYAVWQMGTNRMFQLTEKENR